MEATPHNNPTDPPNPPTPPSEERLSRLETIVMRAEIANEVAHAHFRSEDTMILASQMALNEAQRKSFEALTSFMSESRRANKKLRLRMRETTEKLNALIKVVDGIVTKGGAQ